MINRIQKIKPKIKLYISLDNYLLMYLLFILFCVYPIDLIADIKYIDIHSVDEFSFYKVKKSANDSIINVSELKKNGELKNTEIKRTSLQSLEGEKLSFEKRGFFKNLFDNFWGDYFKDAISPERNVLNITINQTNKEKKKELLKSAGFKWFNKKTKIKEAPNSKYYLIRGVYNAGGDRLEYRTLVRDDRPGVEYSYFKYIKKETDHEDGKSSEFILLEQSIYVFDGRVDTIIVGKNKDTRYYYFKNHLNKEEYIKVISKKNHHIHDFLSLFYEFRIKRGDIDPRFRLYFNGHDREAKFNLNEDLDMVEVSVEKHSLFSIKLNNNSPTLKPLFIEMGGVKNYLQ